MNFTTTLNTKSRFLEYCANTSNLALVQELDEVLQKGSDAQFNLIHTVCNSPISSEILFYLFNTAYSSLTFSKHASVTLKVLEEAYEKCMIWHMLVLSRCHTVTIQTLTMYSNLLYLAKISKISKYTKNVSEKNFELMRIDQVDKNIVQFFAKTNTELTAENLIKFFVFVFHRKIEIFKKEFTHKQKVLDQKKRISELFETLKDNQTFKQMSMLKILEISIVLLILMKAFGAIL